MPYLARIGVATIIRSILSALVSTSFLFVPSLFAQDPSAVVGTPGCGAPEIKFDGKTDKEQRNAQSETGKALVYFIEDDSNLSDPASRRCSCASLTLHLHQVG
jgi:hypothetical protein